MKKFIGITMLLAGVAGYACAGVAIDAPEINVSSGIAALSLLSGGLLVVRTRRPKK